MALVGGLVLLSLVGVLAESVQRLVWGLDVLLLVACVVDFLRTPSPSRLDVARSVPARAGLTLEFERVVEVRGMIGEGLPLELREEFSDHLEVVARTHEGVMGAAPGDADPTGGPDSCRLGRDGERGGPSRLVRVYRSRRRGMQQVGALRLRLTGPLGLLQRQAMLHGEQQVAIEPALVDLDSILALAASERWQDLGMRRLRRRGGASEFESLRDYVAGDDPRLVDWKAFARKGRPIVREFQEERGQELLLLVDAGRRMGSVTREGRTGGWTKLDHALDSALELAAVALQAGDRVGIAVFDSRLRVYVPPARGRRQFSRLREAVFGELPAGVETDLARALREVSVLHRRRANVIVISDVADPLSIPLQRAALSAGSRRHKLILATLDDPALRHVTEGRWEARPAERAAAFGLEEERRQALKGLRQSGARVLDSAPAESAGTLLRAWLEARRA